MEIRNSVEDLKAPSRRKITDLTFGYDFYPEHKMENALGMHIRYSPLTQEVNGTFSEVGQLSGALKIDWGQLPSEINQKLGTLEKVLASYLPSYEISAAGGGTLVAKATIHEVFCNYYMKPLQAHPLN